MKSTKNINKMGMCFSLFALTVVLPGCGSISRYQTVNVTTENKEGQPLADLNCELSNKRGVWKVKTPGDVTIRRSSDNMNINCEDNQWQMASPQQAKPQSKYAYSAAQGFVSGFGVGFLVGLPFAAIAPEAPMVVGGIFGVPGAGIKLAIDGSKGSVYEYPAKITAIVKARNGAADLPAILESGSPKPE